MRLHLVCQGNRALAWHPFHAQVRCGARGCRNMRRFKSGAVVRRPPAVRRPATARPRAASRHTPSRCAGGPWPARRPWPPARPATRENGVPSSAVDARGGTKVLPDVEQHIDHARPHLSRRRERASVIAIADDLPLAAEDAVDGEGESDREAVHATAGPAGLISLDDEVPVVLLDREMDHPEAIDRRPRDGAPERPEQARRAKRREPGRCADGDLHRIARVQLGSGDVWHRRPAARLSAGPLASSAPGSGGRERQPHLPRSSGLDSAHVPSSARVASGCGARPLDSADVRGVTRLDSSSRIKCEEGRGRRAEDVTNRERARSSPGVSRARRDGVAAPFGVN